jgi:hypothetical protein
MEEIQLDQEWVQWSSCRHGNEQSDFIKGWEFLDQVNNFSPLREVLVA